MKPFSIVLFCQFFALSNILVAQDASLKGQVYADGQSVPFASISLEGTTIGVSADMDGLFVLNEVPAGLHTVVISAVGYQSTTQQLSFMQEEVKDLGQVDLKEDVLGLDAVVVTGTMKRTFLKDSPIKVSVMTGQFLQENRSPVSLVEGISMVNGVEEVVECGVCGTNSLRINGLEGPYTAVLMDGTPMFGNLASVYGLNGIPTSLIDRIEVIKGPSSTLYGSEAVAGVINVITKQPEQQPLLSADIRSTTHREVYGNIGMARKFNKWTGFVGADYAYVNDFHDEVADGFGDVVGVDRISLFSKWSMHRKNNKSFFIAAKYLYEDRHNGVQDFLKDRAYRTLRGSEAVYGESIYTHRYELFGSYQLPSEENFKLDYSFSHHDQDSYYGSDYYQARQTIAYGNFLWDKNIGQHSLIAGATYRFQHYDDNTLATFSADENEPSRQSIPGVFIQNEWAPSKDLAILTGARLDHYTAHGPIFAPRLNLKFKPGAWSTIRLNVGSGFRIVNLFTEDHAFVTGQRKVQIEEELAPERSWNVSLNYNQIHHMMGGQGTWDLDLFYTYFNNRIIPDYDTEGLIIYANSAGHAVSRGISFSFAQNFTFPLSFNIGVTLQDVTQTSLNEAEVFETTKVEFAPQYTSTGTLNYRWKKAGLLAAWTFNLTGPMDLPEVYDLDEQGMPKTISRPTRSKTWSRHTLQLTKRFVKNDWQLYAGVENLFNQRQELSPLVGVNDPNSAPGFSEYFDTVYAYAPLSGREFYLGVRFTINQKKASSF